MDWIIWSAVVLLCALAVALALDEHQQPLSRRERRRFARMRRRMDEADDAAGDVLSAERVAAKAWRDWRPESEVQS